MRIIKSKSCGISVFIVLAMGSAWASITASISGVVSDPSGAVVAIRQASKQRMGKASDRWLESLRDHAICNWPSHYADRKR